VNEAVRPDQPPAGATANAPERSAAADTCPDAEDGKLLERWYAVHGGMHRLGETLLGEVEAGLGLAQSEFRVLWFLVNTPDRAAPMNELSRVLRFSTAGTTKLVDRLAEAGLVERHTSPTDRRVTLAALTPAGVEVTVRAAKLMAAAVRRHVVEPLGEESFDALVTTVSALAPVEGACPGESPPPC
jgi:DNA-binding MarR family transcriptional regulator